jgi:hypothetical protein
MPLENQRYYAVGYGGPPAHSRFKKGQSGNPWGRPSGAKNLKTVLNEALNERVIVFENGRRRKITKFLAIIKQVVNQSAKADWRHTKILLDIIRDIRPRQLNLTVAGAEEGGALSERSDFSKLRCQRAISFLAHSSLLELASLMITVGKSRTSAARRTPPAQCRLDRRRGHRRYASRTG